nr:uroporphyrinogen-III synthase [Zhihengliuella flava]
MVLRSPERASSTVEQLAARGANAVVCPVIDFELPSDTAALDAGVQRLASGGYDWLILTSLTTLRALEQRAVTLGLDLTRASKTRVAAVAEASAVAAQAAGLAVDFVPQEKTGAGLVAELPAAAGERVLVAQADIAARTVEAGLAERGLSVDVVTAYRTVDAPADPTRRLEVPVLGDHGAPAAAAPLVAPEHLAERISEIDAVLFTSPSIVRRFAQLAGTDFPGPAIAIGGTTAAELTRLGFQRVHTAQAPTPAAMVDAWAASLD